MAMFTTWRIYYYLRWMSTANLGFLLIAGSGAGGYLEFPIAKWYSDSVGHEEMRGAPFDGG
jgi:hypothetical protein